MLVPTTVIFSSFEPALKASLSPVSIHCSTSRLKGIAPSTYLTPGLSSEFSICILTLVYLLYVVYLDLCSLRSYCSPQATGISGLSPQSASVSNHFAALKPSSYHGLKKFSLDLNLAVASCLCTSGSVFPVLRTALLFAIGKSSSIQL